MYETHVFVLSGFIVGSLVNPILFVCKIGSVKDVHCLLGILC
jgi:hypothetical protein